MILKTRRVLGFLSLLITISGFATSSCNKKTKPDISLEIDEPPKEIDIYTIASSYLGKPYVAGTLDINGNKESLIINTDSVDCVTFVEYVLASAISGREPDLADSIYADALMNMRYKNGKINGYMSRIHYFSQWIYENKIKGIIEEVTDSFDNKTVIKEINFMSSNTQYYPILIDNPQYIDILKEDELLINNIEKKYIPKSEIKRQYEKFKEGDIIAITAATKGLDISHVGFIHLIDSIPHLLHASSKQMKVVVTVEDLASYLEDKRSQTGIRVMRIKNHKSK